MNAKAKKDDDNDWIMNKQLLFFRLDDQDKKLGEVASKVDLTQTKLNEVDNSLRSLSEKVIREIEAQADWRLENTKGAWKMKAALLGGILSFIGIVIKEIYLLVSGAK